VWIWFYDPEQQDIGFVQVTPNSPLAECLRDYLGPRHPVIWFNMMLRALAELGYGMPIIPKRMDAAAVVFWDRDGNAGFFPLLCKSESSTLGFILHQLAQLMIEHPALWDAVSGDDDDLEAVWS